MTSTRDTRSAPDVHVLAIHPTCREFQRYPKYTGLDVSETIFRKTSARFANDPTKHFQLYDGHIVPGLTADCTIRCARAGRKRHG